MAYNLLLVDDSAIIRGVTRKVLGLTDVEVGEIYEAVNGLEAIEVLKDNWVDLILLDINMPVMNGVEFIEEAQKQDLLGGTPIVIYSTEGSKDRLDYLASLGVKEQLRKPVQPEELAKTIHRLLGGK